MCLEDIATKSITLLIAWDFCCALVECASHAMNSNTRWGMIYMPQQKRRDLSLPAARPICPLGAKMRYLGFQDSAIGLLLPVHIHQHKARASILKYGTQVIKRYNIGSV